MITEQVITEEDIQKEYNTFRTNIRYYRNKSNLTQEELAEKADISTSYMKQIESVKGFKNISFIVMVKLTKALDIPLKDLCTAKDDYDVNPILETS